MVLVYIEFLIDTGLNASVHRLRGVGVNSLSERVLSSSEQISHPLLMGPERKEM